MESLSNEPIYVGGQPGTAGTPVVVNTPTSSDGLGLGGGGALGLLGLAALFGGRGFGGRGGDYCEPSASFAFSQRAADNSSQILAAVGKSEGDVKEAFNAAISRLQLENSGWFKDLDNRMCDADKSAIKAGYEARIESLTTKADLLANQNANTISIKDDIKDFRFSIDKQFCETNKNIDDKFCHLEHKIEKGFDRLAVAELEKENRILRERIEANRDREQSRDINHIEKTVEKILCGLRNIPAPTGQVPNVLSGCC